MKKVILLLIVGVLISTSLEAGATQLFENSATINWGKNEKSNILLFDEVDQAQTDMDWFGPVGRCPLVSGVPNYILAQSFIPTKNILTKVELMIGKNSTATYDFSIAIRDDLNGPDLTTANIPAVDITTENFSWEEFDFADIAVTPGDTYYIISWTVNSTDNWYAWGLKMNGTTYPIGTIYYSIDDEETWTEEPDGDMTFKTYGYDNQAPEAPYIDGQLNGKTGVSYEYTFVTTDPDDDDVYYCIDWDDGTPEVCIGPYASGEEATATHTWSEQGTYIIKVKAKDVFNAESDWSQLEVSMPRNKIKIFNILEKLNNFPMIYLIFKLINNL